MAYYGMVPFVAGFSYQYKFNFQIKLGKNSYKYR